jgi:hypothetical protein
LCFFRPKRDAAPAAAVATGNIAYRGHDLEMKPLLVGWQVTISRNESVVWHTGITATQQAALTQARDHIDAMPAQPGGVPAA